MELHQLRYAGKRKSIPEKSLCITDKKIKENNRFFIEKT